MTDDAPILAWRHPVRSVPNDGLSIRREATADERTRVAEQLDVLGIEALSADYAIHPEAGGRFLFTAHVAARVRQACIVTLEPVVQDFAETLSIELRPAGEDDGATTKEHDILVDTDTGTFDNGVIDAGRLIFECVSAGIDPYPRRDGAEFDWSDPNAQADKAKGGAFAALAKLKTGQTER